MQILIWSDICEELFEPNDLVPIVVCAFKVGISHELTNAAKTILALMLAGF